MKKYTALFILSSVLLSTLYCQYPVQVGNPESGGIILPYDNQHDYNWCTTVYPQNNINARGNIVQITYKVSDIDQEMDYAQNQKIFMALTSDMEFTDAGYPDTTTMTKVFDGDIMFLVNTQNQPTIIDLQTPFYYNNTDNLIIHYENRDGAKATASNRAKHNLSDNTSTLNVKYNAKDGSFPDSTGTLDHKAPMVYLGFESGLDIAIHRVTHGFGEILPGMNDVVMDFRNLLGDTIFSFDVHMEVDGVLQPPVTWNGNLYTSHLTGPIKILENYEFAPGSYDFRVWTSNPNGGMDEQTDNDTLETTLTAADYIEIADDAYTGNNSFTIPLYTPGRQSWSAMLINKDSIPASSKICGVAYHVISTGHQRDKQSIFFEDRDDDMLLNTSMPEEDSMQQMFSGSIDYSANGWIRVPFDPFYTVDPGKNILVYYTNRSGQFNAATEFKASEYGANVGKLNYITVGDEFPTGDGTFTSRLPNIRLYLLIPDDAGIVDLDSPLSYFNTGDNDIKVSLKNFGTEHLTSTTIYYQVDDGPVKSYDWSGNLSTYHRSENNIIGNESFSYGEHTLKIWTDQPNGKNDYKNENDTLYKTIIASNPLCGNYVVGEAPSDYTTLKEAIDSINSCGISCNVTLTLKKGVYNAQYVINALKDAGNNSKLTISSLTGDSSDVMITSDSTDFVMHFNGSGHISLTNITMSSDSAAVLLKINNGACHNTIANNQFIGCLQNDYAIYSPQEPASIDTSNIIASNYFEGAGRAIHLESDGSRYEDNNWIVSNHFKNQSVEGIALRNQGKYYVASNVIEQNNAKASYISWCQRGIYEKNRIVVDESFQEPVGFLNNNDTTIIINNFITGKNLNLGTVRLNGAGFIFAHNTVVASMNSGGAVLNVYNNDKSIYNNILVSTNYGEAIYVEAFTSNNIIDYNCLHSTQGNPIGEWDNTACYTLEEWQTTSGMDSNSIFMLPAFASETDFHTNSLALDGAGFPLEFMTEDIDGEPRDTVNPDIGADEFTSTCPGMLKGNYTIGASGDFNSFGEALAALYDCGVDSTVIFSVQDGTYEEQIDIQPGIPGYTENDSIIFQSQSSDSTLVALTWEADSATNYTVKLKGAERIIFKHLQLVAADSMYANVLAVEGGAVNNRFENCIIRGVSATDDDADKALVHFTEDNTLRDTGNIFVGNVFLQGSYGLLIKGNENAKETGNSIVGNRFKNQTAQAVAATYQLGRVINNNEIINNNPVAFDFVAISDSYSDSAYITGNRIVVERDENAAAISLNNQGNYNVIANNSISIKSNHGKAEAIHQAGYYTEIYYNSVYLDSKTPSIAIDVTHNSKFVEIQNNIIANHTGGLVFKCWYDNSQLAACEYNNFYTTGEDIVHWLDVNYQNLSTWEAVSGFGASSYAVYPDFTSFTNLSTTNVLCNNTATPIAHITKDIYGNVRDASTPDMGAVEFDGTVSFSLGEDVSLCAGDEYRMNAGEGFDSYAWSTGEDTSVIWVDTTGVGTGTKTYAVTVTRGAEEYTDSIAVTLVSPVAAPVTDYCFNTDLDSIEISAGDAESYKWSTGDTTQSIFVKTGNWYYVTVIDERGCQDNGYIKVHYNYCLANILADTNTIELHDSIVLQANDCNENYEWYSYAWNTGDTSRAITLRGEDLGVGTHNFAVEIINKSKNNCASTDSIEITVGNNNLVKEKSASRWVNIYPTPVNNDLHIDFSNENEHLHRKISIINMEGIPVWLKHTGKQQISVPVDGFTPGIYLLLIEQKNKASHHKIVVIE